MGYRPRPEARPTRGFTRPRRARSKAKSKRSRVVGTYLEQGETPAIDEVVARTLNSFETLGQQVFAAAPFYEYFDDWVVNLRTAVADFESSMASTVDDRFKDECSRILSETESSLKETRLRESRRADTLQQLSDSERALGQEDREHVSDLMQMQQRSEASVKALKNAVQAVERELEGIRRTRAGFLAAMSRKTKELKEQEAAKRLDTANKELEQAARDFAAEKSRFQEEHEHRRAAIREQVMEHQNELGKLQSSSEADESAKTRLAASARLSDAVRDLLERMQSATPSSSN